MFARRLALTIIACLTVLFLHLAISYRVSAQAWVPPKGDGSVTFTYQKVDVRTHYTSTGTKRDQGQIHTHNAVMALDYGLTDRLALDFDLTFVASKYKGLRPHGPPDTGSYHPMFQDAHIGLRYNALRRSFVLTPFVGFTIPTHNYEVRGHSAVGRGFKEFLVGVNIGRGLDPILRDGYVNARYSFAMHKRFAGLNLNRSNTDWEVGWSATKLLSLRFVGSWQRTHGGFEFPQDIHDHDDFDIHDRVARVNYVQLGGGVSFSLNRSLDVHVGYAAVPVYARNAHGDKGVVIGFSWRFSRGSDSRISRNTPSSKPPTLPQGMF